MIRKGPSESATTFKVGTKKRGNDEAMWEIVKTTTGIQRWQKISNQLNHNGQTNQKSSYSNQSSHSGKSPQTGKSYLTHDNGGRPFLVNIIGNISGNISGNINKNIIVEIYKKPSNIIDEIDDDDETEDITIDDKTQYTKLVKKYTNVERVFVGKNVGKNVGKISKHNFIGNSILIKLKNPINYYVYIGHNIYEFAAPEEIIKYYSLVGNSDVPYPVALSKNYAYFMIGPSLHYKEKNKIGGEYVPKTSFPKNIDWPDAYTQYYELFPEKWYKDRKNKTFPFKNTKLIHKRI